MTVEEIIFKIKFLGLEGLEVLTKFSTNEIRSIYNGIGPDNFPEWLRKIITESAGIFEPAALIHDLRFSIGGTDEDYQKANDEFERNAKTLVKHKYSWWNYKRYIWLNKARRWANYCRIFGKVAWNEKKVDTSQY